MAFTIAKQNHSAHVRGVGVVRITYASGCITAEEIVKALGLSGQLATVCAEIVRQKEVIIRADELGVSLSDEEIQQFCDNFRMLQGLHSAEETMQFLSRHGLTVDDFEEFCKGAVLTNVLRDHLADEKAIADYFVNNRSDLDLARVSTIMVADKNLASEIVMQVTEDGEDFHALAREHSLDEQTKGGGGYVGMVSRSMLSSDTSAKVFNAEAGDLVGPFEKEGMFQLILVEEVIKAELNDEIKEGIKERIFNEWLAEILKTGITVQA